MLKRYLIDEAGATAIEYTLLAALIGVALIGTINALSSQMEGTLNTIKDEMAAAGDG